MAKAKFWDFGRYGETDVCCGELAQACESGTDAEGYGPLIMAEKSGKWRFNSSVSEPSFCPWCGSTLSQPERENT